MSHAREASDFVLDTKLVTHHDGALWTARQKRDAAAATVPSWEALRDTASRIKDHVLSRLDEYLEQFAERAEANGVHVHWAGDGDEHNRIVHGILQQAGAKRLVKSKSMLTEECHLNPFLEKQGIEVVDTDLGERIVQLRGEPPSHIVIPAVHLNRDDIGTLFHEKMDTPQGLNDPTQLARAARADLRRRFLEADAGLTGVNFGIAETGGFIVCTNEGNADLGVHLPPLQIASMGLEKLIPRARDLGVFLKLLARSGTGQALTVYTSHFHAPRRGGQLHIVLVDNGRSEHLGREDFRAALKCIRCGACLNTCPVYRRSGGYSYNATIPGPIGSILSPGIDLEKHSDLPFASTLCGSCSDVCPVKIDIDRQLYRWRQLIGQRGLVDGKKSRTLARSSTVLGKPGRYRRLARWSMRLLRWTRGAIAPGMAGVWKKDRDLPRPPAESFLEWYRKNRT